MKHTTYSDAFKEEALRKVLQRGRRTLGELAQALNMPVPVKRLPKHWKSLWH